MLSSIFFYLQIHLNVWGTRGVCLLKDSFNNNMSAFKSAAHLFLNDVIIVMITVMMGHLYK